MAEDLEGRTLLSVGLDPSYGFGGLAPTLLPQDTATASYHESVRSIAMQGGQVVEVGTLTTTVAGSSGATSTENLIVSRLTPGGFLDPSFGSNGTETIPTTIGGTTYSIDFATDIAVQADGKIDVLATVTPSGSGVSEFLVVRLNPDGSLDTSFGGSGASVIGFGAGASATNADSTSMTIGPDGKIVALGYTTTGGGDQVFAIARLNTNGTPDTTFGGTGTATLDFHAAGASGERDTPAAVAVQPDGSIVVVGSVQLPANGSGVSLSDAAVARLTASGAPDTTFNGTGMLTYSYNLGGSSYDYANDVILEGSSIVIAGDTDQAASSDGTGLPLPYNLTVTRLDANGGFDTTFNGTGKLMLSLNQAGAAFNTYASSLAQLPDGNLLVGGAASPWDSNSSASGGLLLQLTPNGAVDPSFGTDGAALLSVSSVDGRLLVQGDEKVLFLSGSEVARTTAPAPAPVAEAIATTGTGKRARATGVAITFNTDVIPDLLASPALYQVRAVKGRRLIRLRRRGGVSYNAATRTLTLSFAGRTAIGRGFQLVVTTAGIVGADGQVLPATPILILPQTS